MKSSYKKHLYTTTLSLSAAVLLSVIGHGRVAADSIEAPQTEPSTVLETTPASEPGNKLRPRLSSAWHVS